MKILPIVWQQLVASNGETCERCGNTYMEMLRAVEALREQLSPLGIEPVLRTKTISEQKFNAIRRNQIGFGLVTKHWRNG